MSSTVEIISTRFGYRLRKRTGMAVGSQRPFRFTFNGAHKKAKKMLKPDPWEYIACVVSADSE